MQRKLSTLTCDILEVMDDAGESIERNGYASIRTIFRERIADMLEKSLVPLRTLGIIQPYDDVTVEDELNSMNETTRLLAERAESIRSKILYKLSLDNSENDKISLRFVENHKGKPIVKNLLFKDITVGLDGSIYVFGHWLLQSGEYSHGVYKVPLMDSLDHLAILKINTREMATPSISSVHVDNAAKPM
jgi:hypothetical protein